MAVVKIRRTTIFRDCGSKRNAFISALSVLDYDVTCRTPEGKEAVFWVTAGFHPIWCSLRDIRIVRGSDHSSPHIIPPGSPEAGPLPVRVEQAIEVMFLPEDREEAIRIIAGIRNLPRDPKESERIRLAVLKTSECTIGGLKAAAEVASLDWRDVLMGAGFHSPSDHEEWQPCFVPRPISIRPPNGNAIAHLEGIPRPCPADVGFPFPPDLDVRQLRLFGCPSTKGRYFSGVHMVSGCGRYLALEEFDAQASAPDAPLVRLVIVQPATRLQSLARSRISGRITFVEFTTDFIRYDHSEPRTTVIHDECHLDTLEWTALLQQTPR